MARHLFVFAVALFAWATGAGCSTTTANPGTSTVDGAVATPDAQSDVSTSPADSVPNACANGDVRLIQASDYDQSCAVDTDCRQIAEGNACVPCAFECPFNAAINVSALTKYNSDIGNAPAVAAEFDGQICGSECPAVFGPCCVNGKCESGAAGECPGTSAGADGRAQCVAAGGQCLVGGSTCAVVGPQDCNPQRGPSGSYCCLDKDAGSDAAADAAPDPCGGCGQGQQCVQLQGSTTSVCAGAHCGTSTADGGACPAGQTCRAVSYDPCPPPPPGQAQCNIASVTYNACVSDAADASAE